ncbi:S1C family serine protease [Myxococcus landrumensis]|uniref:Serine protease n=1 Tax=Myxococcus landrumensis TaxID=2813577 RepID=A0ABX7N3Q9_9BACT|nr:S1C family serine protease [Myxococcus landrumus]QSQ13350.1 serine protease [Myxococcus landrumus]
MSDESKTRCLRCGAPDAGNVARCVCGSSLLVDVVLKEAVEDERLRFALARAIALLGAPAPAFSEARKALTTPDLPIVRGVFRAFAEKLLAVFSAHGVSAVLHPTEELAAATPPSSSRWLRVVPITALVLGGVIAGIWMARSPKLASATSAVTDLVPGGGTETAEAAKPAAPAPLSTKEIGRLASPSTLSLRCEGKTGSGFFVEPELALTNEHVVCPPGKMMTVVLPDGRQLLGETLKRDAELDIATVRVVGANARPLKLGDVTQLEPGDPLVIIGSPKGLDFTVHEGKVGFVGRQYLGTGYVQVNASVNPGNSGGPLLNGQGEVVGIVSLKIENADGLGLALPLPYASKLISFSPTPEASARWEEQLKRVARDEEREIARFKQDTGHPALLPVRNVEGLGLIALLVERFDTPPTSVKRRMELEAGGTTCTLDVEFDDWRPLSEAMNQEKDSRRLRWFISRGLTSGVHLSGARLPVESCSLPSAGTAWLKVGQGGENPERVEVSLQDVQAARDIWNRNPAGIKRWEQNRWRQRQENMRTREEAERWRSSFSKARARLARFEAERDQLKLEAASGKQVSKRQREVDSEVKLASEQLADLEKHATQQNVPSEWRQ